LHPEWSIGIASCPVAGKRREQEGRKERKEGRERKHRIYLLQRYIDCVEGG